MITVVLRLWNMPPLVKHHGKKGLFFFVFVKAIKKKQESVAFNADFELKFILYLFDLLMSN